MRSFISVETLEMGFFHFWEVLLCPVVLSAVPLKVFLPSSPCQGGNTLRSGCPGCNFLEWNFVHPRRAVSRAVCLSCRRCSVSLSAGESSDEPCTLTFFILPIGAQKKLIKNQINPQCAQCLPPGASIPWQLEADFIKYQTLLYILA